MPSDKDIESTEKLLRVIRKDDTVAKRPAQFDVAGLPDPEKTSTAVPATLTFSGGNKPCLAVQIGNQALHCALVTYHRGRPSFQGLRSFPYPQGLTPDSAAFAAFLGTCLQKASAGSKPEIWTFISPDQAEYSSLKLPNVAAKDLHQSVFWAVKKDVKFNERTQIFDYRVLDRVMDKGVEKRLVTYFLAQASEVDRLKAVFRQAGYALSGISIEPLAVQNYFSTQWVVEPSNALAHLQLGEESSRIDILDNGRLLFSRNIKSGANSFIEAIEDSFAVREQGIGMAPDSLLKTAPDTSNATSELPETNVLPDRDHVDARALFRNAIKFHQARTMPAGTHNNTEKLLEMILPALERLIRQLERTLEHSVNQMGFQPADKILVSGLPALFPGLMEYIASQFTIPVELFDPLDPDLLPAQGFLPANTLTRMELLPAAGLALSGKERTMNALHTYVHRSREKKERLITKVAGFLGILVLGSVLAAYWHTSSTLNHLNAMIQAEEATLAGLEAFPNTREITAMLAETRDKDARVKRYLSRYMPLAAVGALSSITPIWAELESASFSFKPGQDDERGTGSVKGLVSGQVETLDAFLGSYILMLADSDIFAQPRLVKKEPVQKRPGETKLEFHVDLKLR
ncbi:Tfp pilus assembly protein, ATPase PilM [Desulfonatronum thiosulfatophilum]|uniref:Tfp pilus assembly protein, ATPase PilM n=1 Tax=Desulfonatronum thiosulfatophilum TaxID=617002 RepID=A0A1G6CNI7_9BACT|nr:hypothetical protein [Desulfonatronum thiosulfatophilum]SDB34457.1 Tfp pilus assembly protein, ATPase PilM [Desulfonatronum thiosulfatophilum]